MTFDSVLRFGKYRGLSVRAIARFDALYLIWAEKNLSSFSISDDAKQAVLAGARKEYERSLDRQNGWAWGFGACAKKAADTDRSRRIQIEHEERRRAGQTTCECFPNSYKSCPSCHGAGWINAASDLNGRASAPLSDEAGHAPEVSR